MNFCTKQDYRKFPASVIPFERILADAGIQLFKYYLDITRDEQKRRLRDRSRDPLTRWKTSPIDGRALAHWDDYTKARDGMLERTHDVRAPWILVQADHKKSARLNMIRDLVQRIEYPGRAAHLLRPARDFVFPNANASRARLAR